jgi:hypothetical protein
VQQTNQSLEQLKRENEELKKENCALNNAYQRLKVRRHSQEIWISLLHCAAVAIVSLPTKTGIDICAKCFFAQKDFFKARNAAYITVCLIAFPLIGCVVGSCYGNVRRLKSNQIPEFKTHHGPEEKNIIKRWWQDFTSPENFAKNMIYYPVVGMVNLFLIAVQFIAFKGILEIFKDVQSRETEIKIAATAVVVVCLVAISTIFSHALQNLLWQGSSIIESVNLEELRSLSK